MKTLRTGLAALAATALLAGATATAADTVTLRGAVYTGNPNSPFRIPFHQFADFVNERGGGSVEIVDIVGPEAIPENQMARALADGLVDFVAAPPSYFENLVPGLGGLSAPRVTTQEMRANGTFEAVNEFLAPGANAVMVGLYAGDVPFHIFTNVPVRTLADFEGVRLRATNTVMAFFTELGAQPMQIGRGEIYTALERGVANGYSNINSELFAASWIDVVDYRVGPGFYTPNIAIFMNLDSYNRLDDRQRAVIHAAGLFVEGGPTWAMQQAEEEAAALAVAEHGFEIIAFSPEETERFLDMAYSSTWNQIAERAPDFAARIRPLVVGD
jgi:TRAP-type C4-dicarboxylate transport system substrate-binding protein